MKRLTPQQVHAAKGWIEFFERIPKEKWCKDRLHRGDTSCALGHIENTFKPYPAAEVKAVELQDIIGSCISDINDFGPLDAKTNVLNAIKRAINSPE